MSFDSNNNTKIINSPKCINTSPNFSRFLKLISPKNDSKTINSAKSFISKDNE